jgi:pyruvate ferredoxin oxidoreductase alpha subunit
MAWRIAEDRRVLLPIAIGMDGAYLTHSQVLVKVPSQAMVEQFLPPYDRAELQLHPDNPITIAPQVNEDWLIEIRKQSDEAMKRAKSIIPDVYADFHNTFGRGESPWFEEYMMEDAEIALLGQGTIAMPLKVAVRQLRAQGHKVGVVRLKWLRPFPTEELRATLSKVKAVGVIDRDYSFGSPFHAGVLATEIRSALYSLDKRPHVVSFIAGLGGREVTAENVVEISDMTMKVAASGKADTETHWIGVRG